MTLRRYSWAAGAVSLCALLAGCGTTDLDAGKMETQLRTFAHSRTGLVVNAVSCPDNRPAKKGDSFTCTLNFAGGDSVPFTVTPTDSSGHLTYEPKEMVTPYVQVVIVKALKAHGISAAATCPQTEPIVVGATFTCAIKATNGQTGTADIKITSKDAGFTVAAVHAS